MPLEDEKDAYRSIRAARDAADRAYQRARRVVYDVTSPAQLERDSLTFVQRRALDDLRRAEAQLQALFDRHYPA